MTIAELTIQMGQDFKKLAKLAKQTRKSDYKRGIVWKKAA